MSVKICVITAARSEYGLLRWMVDELHHSPEIELQLIVTGAHLANGFGLTYKEIEKDGYPISEKIEIVINSDSKVAIAKSMGLCALSFSDTLNRLNPDIIVVLGDRFELLPICNTALVMNIPIAHISGGDITEGAIDNEIRNALSMMANLHFPGTHESGKRLEMFGIKPEAIHVVGEPGLENFLKLPDINRESLANDLALDSKKKWVLLTYHPETKISQEQNLNTIKSIIQALSEEDLQVIMTLSNSDYGGISINQYLQTINDLNPVQFKLHKNLGQTRYINLIKNSFFMIGNSSSGICESPFLGIPTINIGNRQKGRYMAKNIISIPADKEIIKNSIKQIQKNSINEKDFFYGDGNTSKKIKEKILAYINFNRLNQ